MSQFKLGRLDATRPHGLSELAVYASGKLPAPPASAHYGSLVRPGGFPMDGNDTYGDCVMAGAAHLLQVFNAETKRTDPLPSEDEVVSEYFTLTGGQDSGLNEANVLKTWHTSGLWGNKLAAYAPVNPKDITALHQSIAFYGGCMLGVNLPLSAQQQFPNEWTVVPGSPIEGGHCIVLVGYDSRAVYAVTWGEIVAVSYPWIQAYVDESWCLISQQFVEAGKGPLLDLKTLQADLSAI